jgi:hypothetical protein
MYVLINLYYNHVFMFLGFIFVLYIKLTNLRQEFVLFILPCDIFIRSFSVFTVGDEKRRSFRLPHLLGV